MQEIACYLRRTLIPRSVIFFLLVFFTCTTSISAQTLGGNSVFNFLRLSNTPKLTALGGVNVSHPANEVGMAFQNPALLKPEMDHQLHLVFNDFYASTSIFHLSYGYYKETWKTVFSSGMHYFNYGKSPATDAAGNILGQFRANDMLFQVSAARAYQQRWNYGISLKFISSRYGSYRANGLAMDMGLLYADSSGGFRASVVMKNAGSQLKKYADGSSEELPFEMQAGITQRLEGSPFLISLTAQQMNRFNIRYNDTSYNNANGISSKKFGFSGKLIDHLIIGITIELYDRLVVDLGYNFLRRRDLNIGAGGNGLNGFSYGMELKLKKFMFHFARANYQANTAYSQIGLTLKMEQFW